MEKEREVHQRQHDTAPVRARGTQNIISGSLSKHPCQSLSLPSSCERRTTPTSIVEHNLAAAALSQVHAFSPLSCPTYATVSAKMSFPRDLCSQLSLSET